ncbi:hypothetical protein MCUN1_003639 [Malassezia cuniculi]|uniref:Peroxin/Ferlin domain-containing protein n=1 Tax=Malassezia cuniculi TaxID=948313 RepID=A0AAF0EXX7_9BASI|nr:hypothetical protein MCUN1_003639 [Malassezia cuniculi]
MDQVDRVPPSGMHLLVILAPTINLLHTFISLATWRRGAVSSWMLLIAYTLTCFYGYEVLRYAPQVLPLAWIIYTWITSSVARASGSKSASGASSQSINRTLAQLDDLADFAAALRDELFVPLTSMLSWKGTVPSTGAVATFLIFSWPIWLICMLPRNLWQLPFYTVSTTLGRIFASGPALVVREAVGKHAVVLGDKTYVFAQEHAPKLTASVLHVSKIVGAHLCPALRSLGAGQTRIGINLIPPFPIASFELRHVFLFVGLIALTWCAPWAKLLRMTLWRSAIFRHSILSVLSLLSGSETLALAWRTSRPFHRREKKKVGSVQEYETRFEFAIFENQRWWIGLDWTAALLPNERPSWSDSDNNPVAPPAAFTLPRPSRSYTPSQQHPGLVDSRVSEWRWVDPEWTVDGAQFITSTVYKPHDVETDEKRVREANATGAAAVTDATDRHHEEAQALALDEDVPGLARNPVTMSVDPEGWEYGDNSWDKLSKTNGIGRYTRRRRWIRRAVLVQTVEKGIKRTD